MRHQSTLKRVRVRAGELAIADTTPARLIWEPMRVVPSYAIPESDNFEPLHPAPAAPVPEFREVGFWLGRAPLLDPSVPFTVHTADGEPLSLDTPTGESAAFRLADPGLEGYVVLDFDAFQWFEEDEPIVSHPRDPFHRIDVRRSSRPIRVEYEGEVLAETSRARMLFEGAFPLVRYYLPPEDVRVGLRPSELQTTCAYKGQATHYTATIGAEELVDIAWNYQSPLSDAAEVAGLVCFYHERLDLVIDGKPVERLRTPWS